MVLSEQQFAGFKAGMFFKGSREMGNGRITQQ